MIESVAIGLMLGFAGSFHCIGMCGPIALALPVHREAPLKRLLLILTYNFGRVATYSCMGILAGLVGATFVLAGYQRFLSVITGIIMLLTAVLWLSGQSFTSLNPAFNAIRKQISFLFNSSRKRSLFAIGLLNGLLPCGLVYIALGTAVASGNIISGAFIMCLFGMGTLPIMLALPYLGSFITLRARNRMRKAIPIFIASLGIMLIVRGLNLGIPYVSPAINENQDVSCHAGDSPSGHKKTIICSPSTKCQ